MKIFKTISIHLFVFFLIILPVFALAQDGTSNTPPSGTTNTPGGTNVPLRFDNPLKSGDSSLMSLLMQILNNIVMPIGAVLAVMYIIYAGFTYVTAQGNPKKVEEAHSRLLWALIGTGILLGAAGISKVVQTTVESVVAPIK